MDRLPIPGFNGYLVDTSGRVYSEKKGPTRQLNPSINGQGYMLTTLCRDGKEIKRYVHHLILETFVGPRPDGCECLHGNGIRDDNRLCNLRWGTKKENAADAIRHGTATTGWRNKQAKLTEHDVGFMRDMRDFGFTPKETAKHFNVSVGTIRRVFSGETYRG